MKSRQRTSAKNYRILFGKLQAGIFTFILCVGMAVSFSLGYLWGARGTSNEANRAEAVPDHRVLKKGGGKAAERGAAAAQIKVPESKPEVANKPTDGIKPKFYQDLLKDNQEDEPPIEPIKLPMVKKEIHPKPTPSLAAGVEKTLEKKKLLGEKADRKKENTSGAANDAPKRAETDTRASKPWAKASGYTIQVVSVRKFDQALQVVRKLRGAGFQPFIKNADLGAKGKWYRVRVGHYREKADAQKALSEMRVRIKLQQAKVVNI